MMTNENNIDWQAIIFSPDWMEKLDKLALRRFGEGGLAEEASSYVIECLSKNNWQALTGFKGNAKPETYLHTLTSNYIEEFSRKRFGRPRPPEWLKRQGEFWVTIWKLICMERQIAQTVIDRFNDLRDSHYIKDVIRTIKARIPWCGSGTKEVSTHSLEQNNDESPNLDNLLTDHSSPDALIDDAHGTELLLLLNCLLNGSDSLESALDSSSEIYESLTKKFNTFSQKIELSTEETLILKMVYQDGLKKSAVAKSLGMQAHLPGRILKRAFNKIESAMDHAGFNIDDISFESA